MRDVTRQNEITLAIYPFENIAEGNGLDVFCRSFQMDLVTELSRFRQFRIMTPSSLREEATPDADYTIRGSFYSYQDRLKINARLMNNLSNHVAWADSFEGSKESIFSIQEDLLTRVVSTLQQQLNYDLLTFIRKKTRIDLTAYEHWLYGMEALKKGSLEADEKARAHFQRAIEIDPGYPLAYSGMSMTYFNEWSCQLWERWEVSQKGAYEWAHKAFELDEQNYVAACVLGRVYLYEGKYEMCEYYLRRALRLNPNDTDNLVQIASCFVFLGYPDEADELYRRVLQLNPLYAESYRHIGAFIAFERGLYDQCLALGANVSAPWIDFPGVMAAAYYYTGDIENMRRSWQIFIDDFEKKILKGPLTEERQAVQWIMNVNPYKGKSNLIPFWEYISGKKIPLSIREFPKAVTVSHQNYFLKENEVWQISFEGTLIHLTEVKGFYDVVKLLENPEKQFHCLELFGSGLIMSAEPVFDEKAKRSYQKRIASLQEEIRLCEEHNDLHRTAALRKEYDDIIDHLSTSLGLGKKVRVANDPVDKTRSAVTWRIRNAIQKIRKANPSLGKHLALSIKTGLFCSYTPERPVEWLAGNQE